MRQTVFLILKRKKVIIMNTIPTVNMTATGKNITALRKKAGMTVRDVQNIFGFANPQAIYNWQNGSAMPTIDNMVILAALFDVTIDTIVIRN